MPGPTETCVPRLLGGRGRQWRPPWGGVHFHLDAAVLAAPGGVASSTGLSDQADTDGRRNVVFGNQVLHHGLGRRR